MSILGCRRKQKETELKNQGTNQKPIPKLKIEDKIVVQIAHNNFNGNPVLLKIRKEDIYDNLAFIKIVEGYWRVYYNKKFVGEAYETSKPLKEVVCEELE